MTLSVDVRARVGGFEFTGAVEAQPGEVLAVIGPNGAGKSTLLGAIAGHLPDVTGSIRLAGIELHSPDGRRVRPEERRVGLLGQRSLLFPHLTVVENVAFGPRAQGVSRTAARARASELLDEVGLSCFEDRRPSQLSGGQQQRAAIARALAAGPDALLLDEPFSALDAQTAGQARRLIAGLRDRTGIPMVLVTHDALDAVVLATRTVVVQDGAIVQDGPTADVLGHPATPFVAALAGVNLVTGVAAGGRLVVAGAELSIAAGAPVADGTTLSAAFAPGAVRVRTVDAGDADAGLAASWTGVIDSLEPVPGGVRMRTREHPEIAVDCASAAAVRLGVDIGSALRFSLAVDDVSVRSEQ